GCDGCTRAATGATGGERGIPGIPARAPKGRLGDGLKAELRRSGAAEKNQTALTGAADKFGISGRHVVSQGPTAISAGVARLFLSQVLQQDRHPAKGRMLREPLSRSFAELRVANRIDLTIGLAGAIQGRFNHLTGSYFAPADQISQRSG